MIQFFEPSEFESRYKCNLTYKGSFRSKCDITYDIKYNHSERGLILIRGNSDLGNSIINDNQDVFDKYHRILKEIPSVLKIEDSSKTNGRIEATKKVVNEALQYSIFDDVSVAIHKFGYVPIVKLPKEMIDEECNYDIGIYPQDKQESGVVRSRFKFPAGIKNDNEFLKSLTIEPVRLIEKYLEDIGEHLHLIEHSNRIDHVFKLCKEIEEMKGESIDSKTYTIFDKNTEINFRLGREKQKLIDELKHHPSMFMARFGRQLSMLFINEIYSLIGLEDDRNKYYKALIDLENEFNKSFSSDKSLEKINPLIDLLHSYNRLNQNSLIFKKGIEIRNLYPNKLSWERRFAEFFLFIATVNSNRPENYKPSIPKLFISHQHSLEASEGLLSKIEKHAKFAGKYNSCSVLKLNDKRDDYTDEFHEEFKRVCRALIWLSDKVYVLLPEDGKNKGYKWLIREMEHTLVAQQNSETNALYYFKQKGFKNIDLIKDLDSLGYDFLSLEFRRKNQDRIEMTKNHFDRNSNQLQYEYKEILDHNIQDRLNDDLNDLPFSITSEIIFGFLSQFTSNTIPHKKQSDYSWLICQIDRITSERDERLVTFGQVHNQLEIVLNRRIDKDYLRKRLYHIQKQFRKRKLKVFENHIPLLEITGDLSKSKMKVLEDKVLLKGNISEMISFLLPKANLVEINDLKQDLYMKVFSKVDNSYA